MSSLRRFDWVLHLLTIVVCCFFIARSLTTYLGYRLSQSSFEETKLPDATVRAAPSASPFGTSDNAGNDDVIKLIVERNIFNASESGVIKPESEDELVDADPSSLGAAVKTNLDIKILGTLSVGDGRDRRSSVVISGGKGEGGKGGVDVYHPADNDKTFGPNIRLVLVGPKRIEFVNGGRLEFAELEEFSKKSIFSSPADVHGGGTPLGDSKPAATEPEQASGEPSKIVLDQKTVDDALQNLDKLQQEARLMPAANGMKVVSVKPGGLASKLGLKRGDVLEKINGQELDPKKAMEFFMSMKDLKNFTLDLSRGGKSQNIEYEIK